MTAPTAIDLYDNTVSKRFFWWPASTVDRWPLLHLQRLRGGDENCNRTLGIRIPGGVLFVCLNVPLRQKPCPDCLRCP